MFRKSVTCILLAAFSVGVLGCESNSGTGTLIGGGAGAGAGALIGSNVAGKGNRTEGALVGAGVGALVGGGTGYLIGREGDKKEAARKRERDREDRYYQQPPPPPPSTANPQGGGYVAPPAAPTGPAVSKQDVILWAQRGTPEGIIIDRIQRSGTRFNLTTADENQLRDGGVTEATIRAMKSNAAR